MKVLIILVFVLISSYSKEHPLESEYNYVVRKLDSAVKELVLEKNEVLLEDQGNGFAIFTKSSIDTISLENGGRELLNCYDEDIIWFASSEYMNNILEVSIGDIFGNQSIEFFVSNGEVAATFEEFYKTNNFVKMNKSDTPINRLQIPLELADIELTETNDFINAEVIYGKLRIITKPYYLRVSNFGGEFKCVKREYEFHFKFKVRTEFFYQEHFRTSDK